MISKKILITDKAILNRVLYWLNFQPSIYNPTIKTIIRNGAIFGIELTPPKEKLDFISETNNTLLYYYINNNLENLPSIPKQAGVVQPIESTDTSFNFDTSNVRGAQSVIIGGPKLPIITNIADPITVSKSTSKFITGKIVIDNELDAPCDCITCYGICCRPSGLYEANISFIGNITDHSIECDSELSIYYHRLNNAIDAVAETNIIEWFKNNGWLNVNLNQISPELIGCDFQAAYNITATCYGDLNYDTGYEIIPLSSGQANITWNENILYACDSNSKDRIFDENLTQNECEDIGGNWLPYCSSNSCEIQAITNITFNNNGLSFDISNVILPSGSQDLNIIPVLSDIDTTTYENKIGFNVSVGNLEPSSTGNIIIPITSCDTNYSSEYVQFSPSPSEIMIITNVTLNTSDNPGLVFNVISVTGTIDSTEQKTIPISSCN